MAYTTDDLMRSIRLRGMIPIASGTSSPDSVAISPDDILMFANEEMTNDIVPTVMRAREDFYTVYTDYPSPANDQTELPIPSRAVGATIRSVRYLNDPQGLDGIEIGRKRIEDIPYTNRGFYVMNNGIRIVNRFGPVFPTVRVYWHIRPNQLVATSKTATVVAVSGTAIGIASQPAEFQSGLTYDVVQAEPNFGTLVWSSRGTFDFNGNLVLAGGVSQPGKTFTNDLSAVSAGDVVSIAGQTSIIQAPTEFHPVLAQAVVCRCLEAIGDTDGLKNALARLNQMRANALVLISNRAEEAPQSILNPHSYVRQLY